MRTTIRLPDAVLERARREAARRGITLTALIEQGLQLAMRRRQRSEHAETTQLPLCSVGGGLLPGVDLNDSASLQELMESAP